MCVRVHTCVFMCFICFYRLLHISFQDLSPLFSSRSQGTSLETFPLNTACGGHFGYGNKQPQISVAPNNKYFFLTHITYRWLSTGPCGSAPLTSHSRAQATGAAPAGSTPSSDRRKQQV